MAGTPTRSRPDLRTLLRRLTLGGSDGFEQEDRRSGAVDLEISPDLLSSCRSSSLPVDLRLTEIQHVERTGADAVGLARAIERLQRFVDPLVGELEGAEVHPDARARTASSGFMWTGVMNQRGS